MEKIQCTCSANIYAEKLKNTNSVANCFKWHTTDNNVNITKQTKKNIFLEKPVALKANNRTYGCNNQIYELLRPQELTSYQHLLLELQESVYDYWKNKKNAHLTPDEKLLMNTIPHSVEKTPLKDIIFPNTIDECANAVHENYIKSHNDYWPGEQIKRNYDCPFTNNFTFGIRSNTNPHGCLVAKCLNWSNRKRLCILNEIHAKHRQNKNNRQLGKRI